MIYNHLINKAFLLFFALILTTSLSAEITPDAGKKLFKDNCASCHAKDMKTAATGPALGGVQERWGDYPESDLYAWIRNSQALVSTGHPRANEIYNEYDKSVMTAFPSLTDDEVGSLLTYIQQVSDGVYPPKIGGVVGLNDGPVAKSNTGWMYWALAALLGFLAIILLRIVNGMSQIAAEKTGELFVPKTLKQSIFSKGLISFLIFGLIIFLGYFTVNNAVGLGRQQGYAPEQPIAFSHETHAGINKIDCQYCHDGARRSKHAVIPAANTCINCHAAIKEGSEYGTAEITKIYASLGYDPTTNKYVENYNSKSAEEVEAIYTKWIGDTWKKNEGVEELGKDGEKFVSNQWSDIVDALTNDQKKQVQGPIEWIRIHNLPDHVYFNHSQHVTVGKLECQDCHGKVEDMKVVEQMSPLSMGWCINCHRETEVKFAENDYYKAYENYHEGLSDGSREKVTVKDIGGLECQKCHY